MQRVLEENRTLRAELQKYKRPSSREEKKIIDEDAQHVEGAESINEPEV